MAEITYEQPDSHFEYVVDKRESTRDLKRSAMLCMDRVPGWCSHQKASILIDIVLALKPKTIVEIGVWGGKSLLPMAYTLRCVLKGKVYGIDPWDNNASIEGVMHEGSKEFWRLADHESVMHHLENVISEWDLTEHVELVRSTSLEAPPVYDIDILHIDGNHSDVTSFIDVTKWVPLVRRGGWIIFDDMNWYENGMTTTQRAIDYLNEHCHLIAVINESCQWGIWYKP